MSNVFLDIHEPWLYILRLYMFSDDNKNQKENTWYRFIIRGVHSGYRVDFGLGVLDQFEIGFCVHSVFYIIVNHFKIGLNQIRLQGRINSGACFEHFYL